MPVQACGTGLRLFSESDMLIRSPSVEATRNSLPGITEPPLGLCGRYVIGRVVLKEPSNAVSISTILQIAVIHLKRCIKWDLKVESQSGIKMWNLKVQHHQSGVWSKSRVAYKPEYYVNIWDPWMMDSFKTTSSVLGKRSIPADLINMIQEFTHTKDQHTD